MSGGPLDVSLRVRMRYEGADTARRATGDLQGLAAQAQRFGQAAIGGKLTGELRNVSGQAQATGRELTQVQQAAMRLGSGDSTGRLAGGLKDAGRAAGGATRDLTSLSQVAARFGSVSTVSYLARDLKAVHTPAQALRGELLGVGKAAEGIGRSRGLAALEADLQSASRRADELERRLGMIGRRGHGGGGGGSHAGNNEFANEALRASGLGMGGLRLGMGGAAAGGLAVGAGIAATALATRKAIDFEHTMTEVGKAIGDTAGGMRQLETQFFSLSRQTGIAKTEVANAAAQGGYYNVPREQLSEFSEISAKAAVGFQMPIRDVGEALGPLMKSYKIKDMSSLRLTGDAINTVADSVGVRERDVLNYLSRSSGVANMLGIPVQKNAAFGASLESLGMAPDVASTSFEQIGRRLANANLHKDPEFAQGLRGINMSGRQVKAAMTQDGLGGIMTVLEKLSKLKPEKRSNIIQLLFGEGEVSNISRMVESLDTLKGALDKVSDPEKYRGSLEKTFKIFNSDTTASINRAGAALDGFATRVGQRFNPAIKASADLMARWLGGMTKAMELADRAKALSDKQLKGENLSDAEKAELGANPKLKAETDRQVGIGREDAGRRAIVEQEGRDRARNAPPKAPRAIEQAAPRAPDEEDAAASQAREKARIRLQGQIRDLDAEVEGRQRGSFETTADRLRLRKLRQQYERQYPEGGGDAPAVPGTGKCSDLQEGVKASLASYHEEVDRSLTRTERLAREMGKRIREDLEIKPKVQDVALKYGGGDDPRIVNASLGGELLGSGGGARGVSPGRFGGAISIPRGSGARFGGGRAGGGSELTGQHIGTPGGGRRRGGSSEPAEDGPTEGIPGTLNPRLAGSRKGLMDELDRDPALRRDVLKTASMENRGSPFKMQTVLESMVNRAKMNGYGSLRQAIHSGFYGPVNRGGLSGALSEKDRRDGEAALKQVREGSNAIGYRTDQGMLTDPGARRYMREPDHSGHRVIGGENYFYMGRKGREWARRQEAADAGQPNPAVAGNDRPNGEGRDRARQYGAEDGIRQIKPWTRREPEPRSPRFMDPSSYSLKPGAGGSDAAGGGGVARFGLDGPKVEQHFHGGFDAHEVGRRAQLEQNRELRRTMAGSLHDGGRPA